MTDCEMKKHRKRHDPAVLLPPWAKWYIGELEKDKKQLTEEVAFLTSQLDEYKTLIRELQASIREFQFSD